MAFRMYVEQEAQWACIAHLVFAIYIPLSIYDQWTCVTCQILMHSDQWFMGQKMFQVFCYINLY